MSEIIYEYNWDHAVEDGTFVNISGIAKQWGISYPTAITRTIYSIFYQKGNGVNVIIDTWIASLLVRFRNEIQNLPATDEVCDHIEFEFKFGEDDTRVLWATVEGRSSKNPEPVITIYFPSER